MAKTEKGKVITFPRATKSASRRNANLASRAVDAFEAIEPLYTRTLTKGFFFSLESGVFLASNITDSIGQPVVAEEVTGDKGRAAQWERITNKGAVGRLCHVFRGYTDYATWLGRLFGR